MTDKPIIGDTKQDQNGSQLMERFFIRCSKFFLREKLTGHLQIQMPSGKTIYLGQKSRPISAILQIKSWKVLKRAMRHGTIGFSESYIYREVDTPNPVALVQFFVQNQPALVKSGGSVFRTRLFNRIYHLLKRNSRRGSKKNISAHYDLGNEFFSLWLDPGMTYSSGLFKDASSDLEQAQQEKYDRIINCLELETDSKILEIGCGWGGFAERLIETTQATVEGITLSNRQLSYARERLGDNQRAEFKFHDYRDTSGRYDAIVSIEMIEAVGEENWGTYFQTLFDRLKPGGRVVLQAITISPENFPHYRRKADFIQRHVFPGGMLPTVPIMKNLAEATGFDFNVVEEFGQSYAKTLQLWQKEFDENWLNLNRLGFDDRFRRLWTWYLAYCEGGFREGSVNVGIYQLQKPKP